jgi:16S rRNA processing protein RimM
MAPPPVLDGERGARLIQLGVFGAPQGVRGEIRVKSFTGNPAEIGAYGALTDERGARAFALKVLRALKDDMVVARVEGVLTRDDAAALTHVGLFARRAQLPPPAEGEFYHDDLVGLQAKLADGAPFGRVVAVLNYGAGDILEIAPADGGETILLPFNDATAPTIDFAAATLVVAPPAEVEGEEIPSPRERGEG